VTEIIGFFIQCVDYRRAVVAVLYRLENPENQTVLVRGRWIRQGYGQVPTIQSKAETRHSFCRGLWTGRFARNKADKADPSSDARILTWKCLRSLPVCRCLLGPIAARLVGQPLVVGEFQKLPNAIETSTNRPPRPGSARGSLLRGQNVFLEDME
jgi:hypothetical protein